jgi:hypothetical protein
VEKANEVAVVKTNTLVRMIQACLHEDVVSQLIKMNDLKGRADHKKYQLPSEYFNNVHALFSDKENDDSLCQLAFEEDVHVGAALQQLDLRNFEPMSQRDIKLKFNALFRVRKYVNKNMAQSGTHNSDVWEYIDRALSYVTGIGKLEGYYFVKRCCSIVDLDSAFRPFLSDDVKGSSNSKPEQMLASKVVSSNTRETKSKKQTSEVAKMMEEFNKVMASTMERRNEMMEKKMSQDIKNDKEKRLFEVLKTANDVTMDKLSRKIAKRLAEKLMTELELKDVHSDSDEE